MSVSVRMPQLGESVSEGTVTRWLKKEGDKVEADEPLLEVSTDKVDTEIPSPAAGVLNSIKVAEDETVEVGSELAIIDDGAGGGEEPAEEQPKAQEERPEPEQAEAEPEPEPEAAPEPEPKAESKPAPEPTQRPEPEQSAAPEADEDDGEAEGGASYVTPLVRRLAAEHGVDLADVHGTGVGGRIRKQDVLDAAESSGGKQQQKPDEQPKAPTAPAAKQQQPKPAAAAAS